MSMLPIYNNLITEYNNLVRENNILDNMVKNIWDKSLPLLKKIQTNNNIIKIDI